MMKLVLPIVIVVITVALLFVGVLVPSQTGATLGIASGSPLPGLAPPPDTPELAISELLEHVRKQNFDAAYSVLVNINSLDKDLFIRDVQGSNGSLRTFSSLQTWDLQPVRQGQDDALIRVRLRWSTPVGPIDDVRDLHVVRLGNAWRVEWATPQFPNIPAQVIPVNYLRWDLVSGGGGEEWGETNVDSPHVRIVSMNAVDYAGGTVVLGEVVNEDTIPAFVNVNATVLGQDGSALDEESSFDKILHVLLPKQVSPYRIDFPNTDLHKVKNVRMDVKATLVPASADPVIGVVEQRLGTDALGRRVLQGELYDQSGQVVSIPHVIATFYDNSGRVIWVSDGYVNRALIPETPEPFTVEIPRTIAENVRSYHVVVNQYSIGQS
jgi:hypothetical protein